MRELLQARRSRQRGMSQVICLMKNMSLARGWRSWLTLVRDANYNEWRHAELRKPGKGPGVGSLSLLQVHHNRKSLFSDVLRQLNSLNVGLNLTVDSAPGSKEPEDNGSTADGTQVRISGGFPVHTSVVPF